MFTEISLKIQTEKSETVSHRTADNTKVKKRVKQTHTIIGKTQKTKNIVKPELSSIDGIHSFFLKSFSLPIDDIDVNIQSCLYT